jgi:hypothetical protein
MHGIRVKIKKIKIRVIMVNIVFPAFLLVQAVMM